jgi:glycosyltransferase involved in cell wall biosynthesis
MRTVRVLQVSKLFPPWIGGVERAVRTIAEGLHQRHGLAVDVLVCQSRGRGTVARLGGVRVRAVGSAGMVLGMPLALHFPFVYGTVSRQFDILHLHMPFPLAAFSQAVVGPRDRILIVHYHSDIVRQRRLSAVYGVFLHQLLEQADRIIVTSPNLLSASPHLRSFRRKCRVVPLAVNVPRGVSAPVHQRAAVMRRLGLTNGEKIVLFVGRLVYYKGVEHLIDAMRGVDARLVILGDGPLRTALEQRAQDRRLDGKILFCPRGSDQDVKTLYSLADVFVLPSTEPTEAFGLVQLEAMAYGVPVVNTDLPTGVPWVSQSNVTGLTVPPRDSKALAQALNRILHDRRLARRFSENCRTRVREFTVEKMLDRIYAVYEEVLEERTDQVTRRAG